ncbi:MAG: flavodoxin FldA [Bacteroidales bacterium]|nr:flavodoxin FldA [Bacteroidales bacterium]
MKKTCIIYGSTTGTCERLASKIADKLGITSDNVINVSDFKTEMLSEYDNLILGTSTWGAGDLQDDWYGDGLKILMDSDLSGKTVAIFGCGDCASYSDTFCGGMAELYETVISKGADVIGKVDADDYMYEASAAVINGEFVGLALDEDNESDKTDARIDRWIKQIKDNL